MPTHIGRESPTIAAPRARAGLRFRPRVRRIERAPRVDVLLGELRDRSGLAALDSAAETPHEFSLVACDPLRDEHGSLLAPPESLPALTEFLARLVPAGGDDPPGPFAGGFLGALAYDLGVAGEDQRLPREADALPLTCGGLYTDFLVANHRSGDAWLVLGEDPGDARESIAQREQLWMSAIERALESPAAPKFESCAPLVREVPAGEHRDRVQRAREAIARGDYYQANLAHPFEVETRGHPVGLYARLRAVNPAPYMAYLAFDAGEREAAIVSASPELLLQCDGRIARTRPIKGTIARSADVAEDRALAAKLLASEKDRAELAMIVDLERNDLGRVARPGGVRVESFPELRSYASVHHLCADIVAELAPDKGSVEALASLFPGGSITGAPKLASMAAIAELEREGRGYFSGSLGFLDLRGRALFNILIRTLVWRGEAAGRGARVRYHVGGGITWSSDPAAEDEESLVKGARLRAALEATHMPYAPPGGGLTET